MALDQPEADGPSIFRRARWLVAVSGGGYAAGGWRISRRPGGAIVPTATDARDGLFDADGPWAGTVRRRRRFLDNGSIDKISGDKVKQVITVRHGVPQDAAKKVVKVLKDAKLKVSGSIQGDAVRVTGAKRDDLQAAIALIKQEIADLPVAMDNFRD